MTPAEAKLVTHMVKEGLDLVGASAVSLSTFEDLELDGREWDEIVSVTRDEPLLSRKKDLGDLLYRTPQDVQDDPNAFLAAAYDEGMAVAFVGVLKEGDPQ